MQRRSTDSHTAASQLADGVSGRAPEHGRKRRPRPLDHPPEILSVDEASRRYDGEWVLMKVLGFDEQHSVSHGEVLHHSRSRAQISKHVQRAWQQDPAARLFVFPGGMRRLVGAELREFLAAAANKEYINARW
jgi:hypothetical protein